MRTDRSGFRDDLPLLCSFAVVVLVTIYILHSEHSRRCPYSGAQCKSYFKLLKCIE
jgi:hypothetical protein